MRFGGLASDPVEDGIAPDAELDGAEDLSLDAANQNDADGPLSQAA
jgi:ParB family chromosome partitioning protein